MHHMILRVCRKFFEITTKPNTVHQEKWFQGWIYKVINHVLTEDEFEKGWEMLLDKYKQKNHPYMTQLFEIRKKWLSLVLREFFVRKWPAHIWVRSVNHMLKELRVSRVPNADVCAEVYEASVWQGVRRELPREEDIASKFLAEKNCPRMVSR